MYYLLWTSAHPMYSGHDVNVIFNLIKILLLTVKLSIPHIGMHFRGNFTHRCFQELLHNIMVTGARILRWNWNAMDLKSVKFCTLPVYTTEFGYCLIKHFSFLFLLFFSRKPSEKARRFCMSFRHSIKHHRCKSLGHGGTQMFNGIVS